MGRKVKCETTWNQRTNTKVLVKRNYSGRRRQNTNTNANQMLSEQQDRQTILHICVSNVTAQTWKLWSKVSTIMHRPDLSSSRKKVANFTVNHRVSYSQSSEIICDAHISLYLSKHYMILNCGFAAKLCEWHVIVVSCSYVRIRPFEFDGHTSRCLSVRCMHIRYAQFAIVLLQYNSFCHCNLHWNYVR